MEITQKPTAETFYPILNSQSPQETINILKSLNKMPSKDKQSETNNNEFIKKANLLLNDCKNEIKHNQSNVYKIIDSNIFQLLLPLSSNPKNSFFENLILPQSSEMLSDSHLLTLAHEKFGLLLKESKKKTNLPKPTQKINFGSQNPMSILSMQKLSNSHADFRMPFTGQITLYGHSNPKRKFHSTELFNIAIQKSEEQNQKDTIIVTEDNEDNQQINEELNMAEKTNLPNLDHNDIDNIENVSNNNSLHDDDSGYLQSSNENSDKPIVHNGIQSILVMTQAEKDIREVKNKKVHFFPLDGETVPPNNEVLNVEAMQNLQASHALSQKAQIKMIRNEVFHQIRSQYLSERMAYTRSSNKSKIQDNVLQKAPFRSFSTIYKSRPNENPRRSKESKSSKHQNPRMTSSLKSAIASKARMINLSDNNSTVNPSMKLQYDFSPRKKSERPPQINSRQVKSELCLSTRPNNAASPIKRKPNHEQISLNQKKLNK